MSSELEGRGASGSMILPLGSMSINLGIPELKIHDLISSLSSCYIDFKIKINNSELMTEIFGNIEWIIQI